MTTNNILGYQVRRDPNSAEIGKFDLTEAVEYQRSTISFVSGNNARSFIGLAELGGVTDVVLGNVIEISIDGESILDRDGTLRDDLTAYIAKITYTDNGTKAMIELGIFETDGDRSWAFSLAGDEPSYKLQSVRDVTAYDAALVSVSDPGAPFEPGTSVFLDNLSTFNTTDDDFYQGTPFDDNVNLGVGRDEIRGGDGNDTLNGDLGSDTIYGDDGDDMLIGGEFPDRLIGGDDNDTLRGDGGRDTLLGGDGDDLLQGFDGGDLLNGGDGDDTLDGGADNDVLIGGQGAVDVGRLNLAIENFGPGPAGGWASQESVPRLVGDINGDGAADVVGFGGQRTFTSLNDGTGGLGALTAGIENFAQAQAWRTQDGQTRLLGDVDGDGDDDIIGFGVRSGFVAFSNGDGTFSGFKRAVDNFANAQGWRSDNDTPRIMGDVNGDGIDDIIGFGGKVTFTALGQGDGTFGSFRTAIDNFSKGQGWASNDTFLRLTGDVNGDGLDDLIGFGAAATFTALSNGDGTFGGFKRGISDFAQTQGWGNNDATPRLVADVNGDGIADIVGFGGQKTFVATGKGDGTFGDIETLTDDFNRSTGWSSFDAQPRAMADLNGDGYDDVIGFSSRGVLTRLVGPESDTFVFEIGDGDDQVADFDAFDVLDMRGTNLTAAEALAAAVQVGGDVQIDYRDGTVTLTDLSLDDLTIDHFL